MKNYELFLHWKQGDELSTILDKTKTPAEAMRVWGDEHKRRHDICVQIAKAIDGKSIKISADTHMILFSPQDKTAEKVLAALAKEKLLSVSEI